MLCADIRFQVQRTGRSACATRSRRQRDFSARRAQAGLEMTRSGGWELEIGGPRVVSGGKENGRTGSEPSKSKTVREIPHPPRGVRNDKGQRLEVGGWRLKGGGTCWKLKVGDLPVEDLLGQPAAIDFQVRGHVSQDGVQGSHFQWFVGGNGDVVFAAFHLGSQA